MNVLNQIKRYFLEVWGEVKLHDGKVSWPTWEEVKGSTMVVVVTVAIFGVYLAAVDMIVGKVISFALSIE